MGKTELMADLDLGLKNCTTIRAKIKDGQSAETIFSALNDNFDVVLRSIRKELPDLLKE